MKKIPAWAWITGAVVIAGLLAATGAKYGGALMDLLKIKELLKKYKGIPFSKVPDQDKPASIVKAGQYMSDKEKGILATTPIDQLFGISTLYQMNPDTLMPRQVIPIASTQADFVARVKSAATTAGKKYGINPVLLMAQAAHEGNWGKNAVGGTNIFGHIATPDWSKAGNYSYASTWELVNGQSVPAYRPFRVYPNIDSAFNSHAAILSGSRYKNALKETDPYKWGYAIASAGYATDNPDRYGKKIAENYAIINKLL